MNIPNQRKSWEKFYRGKGGWRGYGEIPYFENYIKKDHLVLDLGSGTGKYSFYYLYKNYKIILMDFSLNALKKNKLYYERICADARYIPFKDNLFDAIIIFNLLEHFLKYDLEFLVKEIDRTLKKDGYIFLNVISKGDFRYGNGEEIERDTFLRDNGIITHYFDIEEIEALFNNMIIIYKNKMNKKLRFSEKQEERIFTIIKK
ncbi:MAG: class I SAM-dependent methyltransferase [Thermoplasmata archaeon]